MSDLSVSYTAAGPVPQTPESLREQLVSLAVQMAPGITTELPGSLIEDIVSTDVGALLICDQARIDLINSVGPLKANIYMLNLLAQQAGIAPQKTQGATTVPVQFDGPAGFGIPQGFVVSDGIYTYTLNDATIIPSSGITPQVTCTATTTGSWAVPAGTVTQIITSVPDEITGLAPIFPYTFYHLTHYWFAAADIPVANDTPVHYADAIRCNVRRPPRGSLPLLTRRVSA
ncbi:Uncharacterised protein [Citrobacter freundii]|nr:Uncharacterised protein [Citrobacter freundii]